MRKNKNLALIVASIFLATLWGCGSNMDSGGDQTGPETLITDAAPVGSNSCAVCHSAIVAQGWTGSAHDDITADINAGCEGCHGGGQFHKGVGPIPVPAPEVEKCATCHEATSPGFLVRHQGDDPATATRIEGYAYTACTDCHGAKDGNPATIQFAHNPSSTEPNKQWAQSAHAGKVAAATPDTETVWGHYDWDSAGRASCQRCHTATGSRNFLTAPASYNAANNDFSHLEAGQNELLSCNACHSNVGSGALRNPGAITEAYAGSPSGSPAATIVYPDASASNVCMGCHLGREVGKVITDSTGDFSNLSFINSHYLAAGGMVFGEAGYEYAGQDYTGWVDGFKFGRHGEVSKFDARGPCVTCHMSSAEPHKFEVVQKDASGVITAVATTACDSCHGNMNATWLEERKETFHEALEALNQALLAKGIEFKPSHPYFYVPGTTTAFKNWDSVYPGKGKDVMGAAFNYNLIEHDPGAYAHNRTYALKLIADSIDFLADGLIDGNGTFTINAASVDVLAEAVAVQEQTIDARHHDGSFGGNAMYKAQGESCGACHADGSKTSNGVIIDQYAKSGHGDVTGAWATSSGHDWPVASSGACRVCHTTSGYKVLISGGTAYTDALQPGQVLSCSGCHSNISTGAIRASGATTLGYTYDSTDNSTADATAVVIPDLGKSTACAYCHGGRGSASSFPISSSSRFAGHHAPAAATLHNNITHIGGEFVGLSYANPVYFAHNSIGLSETVVATDSGPCATCHMAGKDHRFEVVEKDAAGVITAIASSACVACHDGEHGAPFVAASQVGTTQNIWNGTGVVPTVVTQQMVAAAAADLEEQAEGFKQARSLLVAMVANTVTNYAGATIASNDTDANDRRAFQNSKYVGEEAGAFAHNRFYAKRLVFDSIDWLDNGVLDGTITVDAATYPAAAAWLGTTRP